MRRKRLDVLKKLKNLGDRNKIGVAAVRRFARKLGIDNVSRKKKSILLKELNEVEKLYV